MFRIVQVPWQVRKGLPNPEAIGKIPVWGECSESQVHSILLAHNYEVLMVKAGAGDDFGKDTMTCRRFMFVCGGVGCSAVSLLDVNSAIV